MCSFKYVMRVKRGFLQLEKDREGKEAGKGGNRYWKSIGLGFKTPREAIEGVHMVTYTY